MKNADDKKNSSVASPCSTQEVPPVQKRLGFVGVVVYERGFVSERLNTILSEHGNLIIGRMGIPYRERNCCAITLIVDATTDEFGCLTGKLGQLPGVIVKSALAPQDVSHAVKPTL